MSNNTSPSEKFLAGQLKEHEYAFDESAYAGFEAMLESELASERSQQGNTSARKAPPLILGAVAILFLLMIGFFLQLAGTDTSDAPGSPPHQNSAPTTPFNNRQPIPDIEAQKDQTSTGTPTSTKGTISRPQPESSPATTSNAPVTGTSLKTPSLESALRINRQKSVYLPIPISSLPVPKLEKEQPTYDLPQITVPPKPRIRRDRSTLFPDILKNDGH